MKSNHVIYVFCFVFFIVQPSFCMLLQNKRVPCATIENAVNCVPDITAPKGVGCVEKHGVVVLEEDAFTVWDTKERKYIMQNSDKTSYCAVNAKGTQVAQSLAASDAIFIVYDAYSGEQEWWQGDGKKSLPIAFNHENGIVHYNKAKNEAFVCYPGWCISMGLPKVSLEALDSFAHHPSKKQIIFGVDSQRCFLCNYDIARYSKSLPAIGMRDRPFKLSFFNNFFVIGQLYNNSGSHVAIVAHGGGETSIAFIPIDSCSDIWMWPERAQDYFDVFKVYISMAFHPNDKLFFLLDEHNTIDCFDFKTKECIYSVHCKNQRKIPSQGFLENRLAVARNGKDVVVALHDKVIQFRLPFTVLYSANERELLFFMWCTLQYFDQSLLVNDVICRIIKKVCKLYRNDTNNTYVI